MFFLIILSFIEGTRCAIKMRNKVEEYAYEKIALNILDFQIGQNRNNKNMRYDREKFLQYPTDRFYGGYLFILSFHPASFYIKNH